MEMFGIAGQGEDMEEQPMWRVLVCDLVDSKYTLKALPARIFHPGFSIGPKSRDDKENCDLEKYRWVHKIRRMPMGFDVSG
jgi:hypothetical protein